MCTNTLLHAAVFTVCWHPCFGLGLNSAGSLRHFVINADYFHLCCARSHNAAAVRRAGVRRKRAQAKGSEAVSCNTQKSAEPRSIATYDLWSPNGQYCLKTF